MLSDDLPVAAQQVIDEGGNIGDIHGFILVAVCPIIITSKYTERKIRPKPLAQPEILLIFAVIRCAEAHLSIIELKGTLRHIWRTT